MPIFNSKNPKFWVCSSAPVKIINFLIKKLKFTQKFFSVYCRGGCDGLRQIIAFYIKNDGFFIIYKYKISSTVQWYTWSILWHLINAECGVRCFDDSHMSWLHDAARAEYELVEILYVRVLLQIITDVILCLLNSFNNTSPGVTVY